MTSSMSTAGMAPAAVLKRVAKRISKFNLTIIWGVQSVRRHLRQNPSSALVIVLTASLVFNLTDLFYGDIFNGINGGLYNAAGTQLQRYTNISFVTRASTSIQNGRDGIRAQKQTFDRNAYYKVAQRPKLNKKRTRSRASSLNFLSDSPSVISRNKRTDGKHTPSFVDHPMNWKRAELQVPAGAGELPMTTVTKHIQVLVAAYMRYTPHVLSSGLRRVKLSDVIASVRNTGRFMSFLTVRNHRVHVVHIAGNAMNDDVGEKERRDGRVASFLYWMRRVVHSHSSVNNVQFLLDFNDCPCAARMQMNANTKPTAALRNLVTVAAVACNHSSVVPVPVWTLGHGMEAHGDVSGGNVGGTTMIRRSAEDEAIKWSGKQEMAIFEGSFVSSGRKGHCNVNNESRLAFLMSEEPDLLVVTIHPSCKHPVVASGISNINTRAMQAFKYIIHGEEHCRWSLRLVKLMYECPGSVLVKQHVHTGLYFEPLMAEYRQFVPTGSLGDEPDGNFDNLVDQVVWTKENEKVANRIRNEMSNFVKNFLSNQAIIAYLQVLLKAVDERGIGSPIDVTETDMRSTLTDMTEVQRSSP